MYGIGMKRAIFKMGEEAAVETFAEDGAFEVTYDKDWLDPENEEWDLPIKPLQNKKVKGVTIIVPTLKKEIARQFGNKPFLNELRNAISEHFGYLMQKGFAVFVNKEKLRARTLQLYATDSPKKVGVRPYEFQVRSRRCAYSRDCRLLPAAGPV